MTIEAQRSIKSFSGLYKPSVMVCSCGRLCWATTTINWVVPQ